MKNSYFRLYPYLIMHRERKGGIAWRVRRVETGGWRPAGVGYRTPYPIDFKKLNTASVAGWDGAGGDRTPVSN